MNDADFDRHFDRYRESYRKRRAPGHSRPLLLARFEDATVPPVRRWPLGSVVAVAALIAVVAMPVVGPGKPAPEAKVVLKLSAVPKPPPLPKLRPSLSGLGRLQAPTAPATPVKPKTRRGN